MKNFKLAQLICDAHEVEQDVTHTVLIDGVPILTQTEFARSGKKSMFDVLALTDEEITDLLYGIAAIFWKVLEVPYSSVMTIKVTTDTTSNSISVDGKDIAPLNSARAPITDWAMSEAVDENVTAEELLQSGIASMDYTGSASVFTLYTMMVGTAGMLDPKPQDPLRGVCIMHGQGGAPGNGGARGNGGLDGLLRVDRGLSL